MEQATLNTGNNYLTRQSAITKSKISFILVAVVLILLPLERISLPLSLKVVDFALVFIIAYGLHRFFTEKQRFRVPLAFPAWLILVTSMVATLTGLISTDSIIAMVQEIYLFVWFVVLVNLLISLPPTNFDNLLKIWSVVAVLEATTVIMGMFKFGPALFYTSPETGHILSSGLINRGFGTFVNPNAAGAYLSISFFVLLATSWKNWLRAILGLYLLTGILATASIGAITTSLIAFVVLIIANSILNKGRMTLLVGGLLLIIVATFTILIILIDPSQIIPPIASSQELTGLLNLTIGRLAHSISARTDILNTILPIYSNYPLGMGPNTSALFIKTLHNDYLAFLFERGPLGLLGWLWLVIATLMLPLRKMNKKLDPIQWWQTLALWAGFLASTLNAFTHEVSHFRQFWMPLSFLYAAYLLLFRLNQQVITKRLNDEQILV
jgi:hypothetical protein